MDRGLIIVKIERHFLSMWYLSTGDTVEIFPGEIIPGRKMVCSKVRSLSEPQRTIFCQEFLTKISPREKSSPENITRFFPQKSVLLLELQCKVKRDFPRSVRSGKSRHLAATVFILQLYFETDFQITALLWIKSVAAKRFNLQFWTMFGPCG